VDHIYQAAREAGFILVAEPVRTLRDLPSALKKVLSKSDILWAEVDPLIYSDPRTAQNILLATLKHKKPFMAFSSSFVEAGALFALENDYYNTGAQTGRIASEILSGKDPGNIPVEFSKDHKLVINHNTARFLGIKIPFSIRNEAKRIYGLE